MSKPSKPASEIDRLIELASDDKPPTPTVADEPVGPIHSLSVEDQKDPRPSMWRLLIQLRALLPYLARVLPLLERSLLGTNITGHAAPTIDTSNLDRGIAGVGEAQRDLNSTLKAQIGEIRSLHENLTSLSKSIEKGVLVNEELVGSLASLRKLVTASMWVIFVLLVVVIGLAAFAAFGHRPT
jgi:hypothetical protein